MLFELSWTFSSKSLSVSGMDDLLLKRVLFEWLRDRQKEQAHAEIASLRKFEDDMANLLMFQRLIPVLSL